MDNRNRVVQLLIRHYFADTVKYLLSIYRRSAIGRDGDWTDEIHTNIHDAFWEMELKGQARLIKDDLVIFRSDGQIGGIDVVLTFAKFKASNNIRSIKSRLIRERECRLIREREYRDTIGFREFDETPNPDVGGEFWEFIQINLCEEELQLLDLVLNRTSASDIAKIMGRTEVAIGPLLYRTKLKLKKLHAQFKAH